MRQFEILKKMHMGPMRRFINEGDVIAWDAKTHTMLLNGIQIEGQAKNDVDLDEAIALLERQRIANPNDPWSNEIEPINIDIPALHNEIKTETQVILPILGCLKAAEDFLSTHREGSKTHRKVTWTPKNEEQYQFLTRFLEIKNLVDTLGDNLKYKADWDAEVINAWMKENGFDIHLGSNTSGGFSVASILDVMVEWINEGSVDSIRNHHGIYPASKIENKNDSVKAWLDRSVHPFPVVGLQTRNQDRVYMTVLDVLPQDTFAITDKIKKVRTVIGDNHIRPCDGVIFPMIDYNRKVNIDWIQSLSTGSESDDYYVSQALQQTIFRMNEKGAHAKSAVAMRFMKCACSVDHWVRIDKPFLLWIYRPGIKVPLFSGVFAEDVWMNPGKL